MRIFGSDSHRCLKIVMLLVDVFVYAAMMEESVAVIEQYFLHYNTYNRTLHKFQYGGHWTRGL